MAQLTEEHKKGKAAYEEATRDVKIARPWKELEAEEQETWINSAMIPSPDPDDDIPDEPLDRAKDAVNKVKDAERTTEKLEEAKDSALPVSVHKPELEPTLTLREVARARYYEENGTDAPDFDKLDGKAVEELEQKAKGNH